VLGVAAQAPRQRVRSITSQDCHHIDAFVADWLLRFVAHAIEDLALSDKNARGSEPFELSFDTAYAPLVRRARSTPANKGPQRATDNERGAPESTERALLDSLSVGFDSVLHERSEVPPPLHEVPETHLQNSSGVR